MLSLRLLPQRVPRRVPSRTFASQPTDQKPSSSEVKAKAEDNVDGFKPNYGTKASYDQKRLEQRHRNYDSESGQKPTPLQRRFLVMTRLYQNTAEIPEYVAHGTMSRMHDRLRVVFILVGVLGFFSIFYGAERFNVARIDRDKAAGKVSTKM